VTGGVLGSLFSFSGFLGSVTVDSFDMRCKNVSGNPGDDRPPPSHPLGDPKGKSVKKVSKKRKRSNTDAEVAQAVAAAAERAEAGGRIGGLTISKQLTPQQRAAVEQLEATYHTPQGSVVIGGRRVLLQYRVLGIE
jgi:hypothetical protein